MVYCTSKGRGPALATCFGFPLSLSPVIRVHRGTLQRQGIENPLSPGFTARVAGHAVQPLRLRAHIPLAATGISPRPRKPRTVVKNRGVDILVIDCLLGLILSMGAIDVAYICPRLSPTSISPTQAPSTTPVPAMEVSRW